jgi:hypothetical protein
MTTDEAVAWCVARGAVVRFHWYYHNPCVEVHVSGHLPITCSTFVEAVEAQQGLEPENRGSWLDDRSRQALSQASPIEYRP